MRFFVDTTEGEIVKTAEIVGNPTCAELISLLLNEYSSLLNTDADNAMDFQLVRLSREGS